MHNTRKISESIIWVGASDRRLALFENMFPLERGVAYNSYLILDEKTALIDTVDNSISRQFIDNILFALAGRQLDYLVVNHMEPDHCANIEELLLRFPNMQIVGNAKTFKLIDNFYDFNAAGNYLEVKEGDSLSLGKHSLSFYYAPMVHWPEVMVTYESCEKILFSADAFGSFGALSGNIFNDEVDFERDWLADARRYYANIVGKYGVQVQAALKKLSALEIKTICPLHGLVWRSELDCLLGKYDLWSRYEPEDRAVCIIYGSMYGNTENAANVLACRLAEGGLKNIAMYDIASTDISMLIAEIFRCSHIVLAAPTYNAGIYPPMLNLLHDMKALNVQNRTVALIENGSWAPGSAKQMRALLEEMKDMRVLESALTLSSSLKEEGLAALHSLGDELLESLK
ncbi:MAG: FprA family A-type flavoprotein [Oscillospiraceae bacterium]|nr:FprA family A-type flavoprotein [Oscillospiraceae bacterium]